MTRKSIRKQPNGGRFERRDLEVFGLAVMLCAPHAAPTPRRLRDLVELSPADPADPARGRLSLILRALRA